MITFADVKVDKTITRAEVKAAEKVLEDNGIDPDEVETVMQAVGYALLGAELYETEVK